MNTPNDADVKQTQRGEYSTISKRDTPWEWLEGLFGGIITIAIVLFSLPTILDLMQPLGMLSTTLLVSVICLTWCFCWMLVNPSRNKLIIETE